MTERQERGSGAASKGHRMGRGDCLEPRGTLGGEPPEKSTAAPIFALYSPIQFDILPPSASEFTS